MKFEGSVWKNCIEYHMITEGDSVLVGLSGGADSVCLLTVLDELSGKYGFSVCALHVHHGIRGAEADEDCKYCITFCKERNIPLEVVYCDVPVYAEEHKLSEEEAGRILRYRYFREYAKRNGCNKIAVAHHGDDQVETILMNMFRGSGSRGICGMECVSKDVIRPLLFHTRRDIEQYLKEKNIIYCNDSTNHENIYMRNRIRNELIPYIKEHINAKADVHIMQMAKQQREVENYLCESVETAYLQQVQWETSVEVRNGQREDVQAGSIQGEEVYKAVCILDQNAMKELPVAIRRGVLRKVLETVGGSLKDIGWIHIENAMELMLAPTGKQVDFPYDVIGKVTYGKVKFAKKHMMCVQSKQKNKPEAKWENKPEFNQEAKTEDSKMVHLSVPQNIGEECVHTVKWNGKSIQVILKRIIIDLKQAKMPENTYTKWLKCGKIKSTIQLRNRLEGDRISVFADGRHKPLRRWMIDEKIPAEHRERIVVIADGQDIIWVPGYRVSEVYKVDTKTTDEKTMRQQVVEITYLEDV